MMSKKQISVSVLKKEASYRFTHTVKKVEFGLEKSSEFLKMFPIWFSDI